MAKRTIRLRNPQDPKRPFVRVETQKGIQWASCDFATRGFPNPLGIEAGSPTGFYLDNTTLTLILAPLALAGGAFIVGPTLAVFPFTATLAPIAPAAGAAISVKSAGDLATLAVLAFAALIKPKGPAYTKFEQPCDPHQGLF